MQRYLLKILGLSENSVEMLRNQAQSFGNRKRKEWDAENSMKPKPESLDLCARKFSKHICGTVYKEIQGSDMVVFWEIK